EVRDEAPPVDEAFAAARPRAASVEGEVCAPKVEPTAPIVLVVDDHREMNRFICDTLAGAFRVESAYDAAGAIERVTARRPDLVVSDVMMPGMSGAELVTDLRARADFEGIPILMLTAKADEQLRVRLLRESVQDYVTKPFVPEELRARAR